MNKITVIMYTYNRANTYLKYALEGILNQTYKDIDIIIYNNGSTDNTDEVIKSYHDSRITYIKGETNLRGGTEALLTRRKVNSMCKTEYMIVTHDDDIMEPDMLQRELEIMEKDRDVLIVSCNATVIDENNYKIDTLFGKYNFNDEIYNKYEFINEEILDNNKTVYPIDPTILYRVDKCLEILNMEIMDKVGACSDIYRCLKINELPGKIYILKDRLFNRRVHNAQSSKNRTRVAISYREYIVPFFKKYATSEQYNFLVKKAENKYNISLLSEEFQDKMKEEIDFDVTDIKNYYESNKKPTELTLLYEILDIFLITVKYLKVKFNNKTINYVIWGTGSGGQKTKYVIDTILPNMKCVGYIDTFKNGEKEGLPIYQKDEFNYDQDIYVIIGTTVGAYDVACELNEKGLNLLDDYIFGWGTC